LNSRTIAVLAALACAGLVLAQDVVPAWEGFHTWQYAATLAIGAVALAGYAWDARAGADGERGRRFTIAALGALVVVAAGIASGLLGPDPQTVQRAPGTVAPLPDVGAAAFFPLADADEIAGGGTHVLLRRRNAPEIDIGPGERRLLGATALALVPAVAAYVEARDAAGRRLTITQPTNPAFLSPVLFFPQRVTIASKQLPADAFATPALHRQIKAFYFSKEAASAVRAHGIAAQTAVLFAVDDDGGRLLPGGIGFAPSGGAVSLGGLRLRPTLGTYPTLQICAVPYPPALWFGFALVAFGIAFGLAVPEGAERAPGTSGLNALGQRADFTS
jgi:hypothetical protein